jgi:hypothetical protein
MAASSSYSNPIFRSGEECRHSNFNSLQDIAEIKDTTKSRVRDAMAQAGLIAVEPSAGLVHLR